MFWLAIADRMSISATKTLTEAIGFMNESRRLDAESRQTLETSLEILEQAKQLTNKEEGVV